MKNQRNRKPGEGGDESGITVRSLRSRELVVGKSGGGSGRNRVSPTTVLATQQSDHERTSLSTSSTMMVADNSSNHGGRTLRSRHVAPATRIEQNTSPRNQSGKNNVRTVAKTGAASEQRNNQKTQERKAATESLPPPRQARRSSRQTEISSNSLVIEGPTRTRSQRQAAQAPSVEGEQPKAVRQSHTRVSEARLEESSSFRRETSSEVIGQKVANLVKSSSSLSAPPSTVAADDSPNSTAKGHQPRAAMTSQSRRNDSLPGSTESQIQKTSMRKRPGSGLSPETSAGSKRKRVDDHGFVARRRKSSRLAAAMAKDDSQVLVRPREVEFVPPNEMLPSSSSKKENLDAVSMRDSVCRPEAPDVARMASTFQVQLDREQAAGSSPVGRPSSQTVKSVSATEEAQVRQTRQQASLQLVAEDSIGAPTREGGNRKRRANRGSAGRRDKAVKKRTFHTLRGPDGKFIPAAPTRDGGNRKRRANRSFAGRRDKGIQKRAFHTLRSPNGKFIPAATTRQGGNRKRRANRGSDGSCDKAVQKRPFHTLRGPDGKFIPRADRPVSVLSKKKVAKSSLAAATIVPGTSVHPTRSKLTPAGVFRRLGQAQRDGGMQVLSHIPLIHEYNSFVARGIYVPVNFGPTISSAKAAVASKIEEIGVFVADDQDSEVEADMRDHKRTLTRFSALQDQERLVRAREKEEDEKLRRCMRRRKKSMQEIETSELSNRPVLFYKKNQRVSFRSKCSLDSNCHLCQTDDKSGGGELSRPPVPRVRPIDASLVNLSSSARNPSSEPNPTESIASRRSGRCLELKSRSEASFLALTELKNSLSFIEHHTGSF